MIKTDDEEIAMLCPCGSPTWILKKGGKVQCPSCAVELENAAWIFAFDLSRLNFDVDQKPPTVH